MFIVLKQYVKRPANEGLSYNYEFVTNDMAELHFPDNINFVETFREKFKHHQTGIPMYKSNHLVECSDHTWNDVIAYLEKTT